MKERRREQRTPGTHLHKVDARVRPGHRVKVIDLSPRGALIEGHRPLPPGSVIVFQLHGGPTPLAVSARVVRCSVTALTAETGVTYRAGISFEEPFAVLREVSAHSEYGVLDRERIARRADGEKLPVATDDGDGLLVTR